MDITTTVKEFSQRWDCIPQPFSTKEVISRFQNRLIVTIAPIIHTEACKLDNIFRFIFGECDTEDCELYDPYEEVRYFEHTLLYDILGESSSKLTNIIFALEVFCQLLAENEDIPLNKIQVLSSAIKRVIAYSPGINLECVLSGRHITLYPAGAKLLDQCVVDQSLLWLDKFPEVAKHFEQALQIYLKKDKGKYRNLLDNLRFSIEQLLRSILKNEKSLENQKNELEEWLKSHGLHSQILNMYKQLLFSPFSQYQNDAVKHREAWSIPEIEFMIYLTGIFMRLLLQLYQETPDEQ